MKPCRVQSEMAKAVTPYFWRAGKFGSAAAGLRRRRRPGVMQRVAERRVTGFMRRWSRVRERKMMEVKGESRRCDSQSMDVDRWGQEREGPRGSLGRTRCQGHTRARNRTSRRELDVCPPVSVEAAHDGIWGRVPKELPERRRVVECWSFGVVRE